MEPALFEKLDQIRVDGKETGNLTRNRPRRVSVAVDFDRVTTADNFAARRATALEFRYSVIETLKHRRNTTLR